MIPSAEGSTPVEISKADVIRRLREAGFTPDPIPATHHLPEPKGIPAEPEGGLAEMPTRGELIYARPRIHDPNGEPWMVWVMQVWTTREPVGPHGHLQVETHFKIAAAKNQTSYRTEGHWEVGFALQGEPAPEEFVYAVERELSALAGRSIRVTHIDGR